MRFHLKMSRPHENDENDVSFSTKTQTFENDLQSGKIWNATVSVSCGRVVRKKQSLSLLLISRYPWTILPRPSSPGGTRLLLISRVDEYDDSSESEGDIVLEEISLIIFQTISVKERASHTSIQYQDQLYNIVSNKITPWAKKCCK